MTTPFSRHRSLAVAMRPELPLMVRGRAFERALMWEHPCMSGGPILRATSESGDTIEDPSEDALFMMFEDVEAGESTYLIVDSLADTTAQTYAQTSRNKDGTYVVEYRDGSPARHYGTVAQDMRAAHTLVTGWAFGVDGWRDSATWRPVAV